MRARSIVLTGLWMLLLPGVAFGAGKCDEGGEHEAAVLAAREAIRARCECTNAVPHAAYVDCAWTVSRRLVDEGSLPRMCRGRLRQFASRSTCGLRDRNVCCESRDADHVWAAIRRKGDCRLRGGATCVSTFPHAQEACVTGTICRGSWCGDGITDRPNGEQCEPPGVGPCDAYCRTIVCGNGTLDPGEECEPPATATCSPQCLAKSCGDGVVDPRTESCEPPNTPSCDAQCYRIYACGNGIVEFAAGEECEPPGTSTCDTSCGFVHTCGNGVIEPGEECDGQPSCSDACRLFRSACCDLGAGCFSGGGDDDFELYWNLSKPCYVAGGTSRAGSCEATAPCPSPPGFCWIGSCEDSAIDPLPLCCNEIDGTCRDTVATRASDLGAFGCSAFPPPADGDVPRLMLGTCGTNGRCVPPGSGGTP